MDFDMKNILYAGNTMYGNKTYRIYVDTKASLKGWKSGLLVNFGQFLCSWIRIQESQINADPDPKH